MDGHFNIVKYHDIHWWLLVTDRLRPLSTVLSSSILSSSKIVKCMRPISSDADSSGNCRVYNLKVQFVFAALYNTLCSKDGPNDGSPWSEYTLSMVTLGLSFSLGASLFLSLKLMALHVAPESSWCLFSLPFSWRLTNHFLPIVPIAPMLSVAYTSLVSGLTICLAVLFPTSMWCAIVLGVLLISRHYSVSL